MTINNNLLPLVSVITVNYNNIDDTLELLESMLSISYPKIEIFVVDNASDDGNPDIITSKFPQVKLIKSQYNMGFAGGNNLAIPYCQGKYILFINNDTIVDKNFLQPLVDSLEENSFIGAVSPKILYHKTKKIQYAGFTDFNMWTVRNVTIGLGEIDIGQYDNNYETGSVIGTAMLVPAKILNEVGLMTEVFFLYYEEHDWMQKIKNAKYIPYFNGKSTIWHKDSATTIRDSAFQIYYLTRGRILFARRNNKGLKKLISLIYLYTIASLKAIINSLIFRRTDLLPAFFKALLWNLKNKKE